MSISKTEIKQVLAILKKSADFNSVQIRSNALITPDALTVDNLTERISYTIDTGVATPYTVAVPDLLALQVPFREGDTLEDSTITDPATRKERFGQKDHLRHYGQDDFAQRLSSTGFAVEIKQYAKELGKETVAKHALNEEEVILVCRKA